ncbi:unnamed protein product [Rotaria sp. Silwood1]|nr:unnamed protein product [Rotaria sp. Silwood1]CAF1625525.1 unnamed protein product [Rotaria sp. Silwood1]CAF3457644.1 unnamed protein product [Rotaria sp. Silwood1]CAF3779008.1 unnamed protein product [Rotaria sp. Silwood1]CAF4529792.1 unnamed protein product [Rotaria sp. Silwood1]
MIAVFVVLFLQILLWEKSLTVRLEYKYSVGQRLTYLELQIIERHDVEKRLDETIEYIEMNYTEEIIKIDSIDNIQRKMNSIRMYPFDRYKHKQLLETTYRIFENQSINRPAELSSLNGRIIIPPPNEPSFPQDDIKIGHIWTIPIINSLGEIHYKLIDIDEYEIAHIEFEDEPVMYFDASLTGKWTFDVQRGITLTQETVSSSSMLADHRVTKTITKKLLSTN